MSEEFPARLGSLTSLEILTMEEFWDEQRAWSEKTFGHGGPEGALKHLKKEAEEALEKPDDLEEYADLLFLTLDSARRAGFSYRQLLRAISAKLIINKNRRWGPRIPGEPCEHIRDS